MKTITTEETRQLLEDYGHHANVTVPVKVSQPYTDQETGKDVTEEWKTVLNNAMVYNPYGTRVKQYGMSNNKTNAENAMKFIKDRFAIYSSVFNLNDTYKIED